MLPLSIKEEIYFACVAWRNSGLTKKWILVNSTGMRYWRSSWDLSLNTFLYYFAFWIMKIYYIVKKRPYEANNFLAPRPRQVFVRLNFKDTMSYWPATKVPEVSNFSLWLELRGYAQWVPVNFQMCNKVTQIVIRL